jgi:gluconolactonase
MKKSLLFCSLIFVAYFISVNSFAQSSTTVEDIKQIVAPGATLKKISSQFKFTEGPAVDKEGNVYFTDQPNDQIWKYSTDGSLSLFMEKTGRSNGLYLDKKGNIISCADEKGQIIQISTDKKVKVLAANFNGKQFNGPNDLWVDSRDGVYFTDPYYQRDYWQRKQPDFAKQNVYYLAKGKKEAIIVDSLLMQPNGITGSKDGKHLFVADIKDNKTYVYEIGKNGTLHNRKLFVSQGSDGMTIDNDGNIYLTGRGVTVYDKNAEKIAHIPVPAGWTANLIFGGRDGKTLFITALESVYTLEMNVSGK